ncbi:neuropeptide FF receptor 2-like [Oculina patagonica]
MNKTSANNTATSSLQTSVNLAVFFTTFFVGLAGNLLVVVIIIRRKTRKRMNDFFVLNLSVSDLCLIIFCLPALIYVELVGYVGSRFYCKFVWPMVTVSYCSSIYTITSMACYRCKVLLHPFELPPRKKTVLLWISTIWLLSFVIATPLIIVSEFQEHLQGSICYENWPSINFKRGYTVALFILQYLLPLLTIAVAYIRIGIDLTRTKVRRASVTRRGEVSAQGIREENIKIIKVLLTIVVLFAFCMLPVHLAWISLDFGGKRGAEIAEIIFKFSDILAILHSCLNAVIYGALTKHLRHGFVKFMFRPLSICYEFPKDETRATSQRRRTNEPTAEEMETFNFGGKSGFCRKTAVYHRGFQPRS